MRHVFSIARFVPDPARGEFVNIGIIVGSDDSREWLLQKVSRIDRARRIDEFGVLPEVTAHITSIASALDAYTDANESLIPYSGLPEISEDWLHELSSDLANVLQFTPPSVVVAESAQEAVELLWPQLIAEPEARIRNIITKHRALAGIKESFRYNRISREHWKDSIFLRTNKSHSMIDFAVHNGKVVHMMQCWSFQVANQESLIEDIKAWGWTIRDLRVGGGEISADGQVIEVEPMTPLAAVYIPPVDVESGAFTEARSVFSDQDVRAVEVPLDAVENLGAIAAAQLKN